MSKLSKNEIEKIAKEKGLLINNPNDYINLDTDNLIFECKEGHTFTSNLKTVRDFDYFECPLCLKEEAVYVSKPPQKSGYRIIGFDQATQHFGISVYDDGKLVYFDVINFTGDLESRLVNIGNFIDSVCKEFKPDKVVFEDIQLQGNQNTGYKTFKTLAELMGVIKMILAKNGVKHECVLNKVWQARFKIFGKDRISQKIAVTEKVKELYGIDVVDDIADAILIGRYGVLEEENKKLF